MPKSDGKHFFVHIEYPFFLLCGCLCFKTEKLSCTTMYLSLEKKLLKKYLKMLI